MEFVKSQFFFFKFIVGQGNILCRGAWAKAYGQEMAIEVWRTAHKSIRRKNMIKGVSVQSKDKKIQKGQSREGSEGQAEDFFSITPKAFDGRGVGLHFQAGSKKSGPVQGVCRHPRAET